MVKYLSYRICFLFWSHQESGILPLSCNSRAINLLVKWLDPIIAWTICPITFVTFWNFHSWGLKGETENTIWEKNVSQCAVCAAMCPAQMFHRDIANCFHNIHSLVRVPWVVAVCSLDHLKAEVVSFSHLPFIALASLSKFACVPQGCLDSHDVFLLNVSWWLQVLFSFVV